MKNNYEMLSDFNFILSTINCLKKYVEMFKDNEKKTKKLKYTSLDNSIK